MDSNKPSFIQEFADESAVTAIEYALLGSLIAVAIVVGVSKTGFSLSTLYTNVGLAVAAAL